MGAMGSIRKYSVSEQQPGVWVQGSVMLGWSGGGGSGRVVYRAASCVGHGGPKATEVEKLMPSSVSSNAAGGRLGAGGHRRRARAVRCTWQRARQRGETPGHAGAGDEERCLTIKGSARAAPVRIFLSSPSRMHSPVGHSALAYPPMLSPS
ncbi:hypothetical protein OBBRIDRAFT_107051 [Obba rivulosa]|uniref:Uncharacterized protein n=1 Tax=Obba rivulosa TaxID=1052685 RepID=A0A8E2AZ61_9APHY|nr:hypothetical protein OBBRIDRAFT_107051 [Obba rivulosa]